MDSDRQILGQDLLASSIGSDVSRLCGFPFGIQAPIEVIQMLILLFSKLLSLFEKRPVAFSS